MDLLNQYLSPMSDVIINFDGYVDKYEGDAIMAVWGVPYPNEDHRMLACMAALEQQQRLKELRPKFRQDFGAEIYTRMGINSGEVTAGYMGSSQKMSYTVMGDAVNTAARFEPLNKIYGTDIAIGEATYDPCRGLIEARLLDRSIVVLTSDHGEELGQHAKYFHHECSTYDAVLHVPLLLRLPQSRNAVR